MLKKIIATGAVASLSLVGLVVASPAYAAEGAIPDDALAACFNTALARDVLTPITVEEVSGFAQNIACDNAGVESLEGLQYLTGSHSISVANNNIADITPLAGLDIDGLFLDNNPVSSLEPLRTATLNNVLSISGTQVSDLSPIEGSAVTFINASEAENITDVSVVPTLDFLYGVTLPDSVTDYTPLSGNASLQQVNVGVVTEEVTGQLTSIPALTELSVRDYQGSIAALDSLLPQLTGVTLNGADITDIYAVAATGSASASSGLAVINSTYGSGVTATYVDGTLTVPAPNLPQLRATDSETTDFLYEFDSGVAYESVSYVDGNLVFVGVPLIGVNDITSISMSINPDATDTGSAQNPFAPGDLAVTFSGSLAVTNILDENGEEPPVVVDEVRNLTWLDDFGVPTATAPTVSFAASQAGGIMPQEDLIFAIHDSGVLPAQNSTCLTPTVTGENAELLRLGNSSGLSNVLTVPLGAFLGLPSGNYAYTVSCADANLLTATVSFSVSWVNDASTPPVDVQVTTCPAITYAIDGDDVIVTMPLTATVPDTGDATWYNLPNGYHDGFFFEDNVSGVSYTSDIEVVFDEPWSLEDVVIADGVRTYSGETLTLRYAGAAVAVASEEFDVSIGGNVWMNSAWFQQDGEWFNDTSAPMPVECNFTNAVVEPPVVTPPVVTPPVVTPPVNETPVVPPTVDTPTNTPVSETPAISTIKDGGDEDLLSFVLGGIAVMLLVSGAVMFVVRKKLPATIQ